MSTAGYDAIRLQGEAVVRALRDMALLLGEPSGEPAELETGGEIVPGLGLWDDAAALELRATDLSQGLFKIIVLGEFKNGKSTLLNAMLGSKTLPAKAAPSTAIITVLVYGDRQDVVVYETGKEEPRIVSWDEFVGEFQLSLEDQETLEDHGTVDRFRQVEYAQIECQHPICASGVKLIDSPGLGEHISRTRVATNFLRQSQAVICVLNATRILGQDERVFIEETLGQGRLNHVFFVVNRVNQLQEGGLEEIQRWTETALQHHFLEESGELDRELYRRRVFFVDARGALEARSTRPIDEARLAASGVPALERELEAFLTGGDKVAAALQSTVQLLHPIVAQAQRRITQEKAALDRPLDDLERRRSEAERRLAALEARKDEMERTILLFAGTVKQRVYADLRSYVDELNETWEEDSQQLIDLDQAVSIRSLLTSYAQPEARERMAAAIGEQVQRYLQIKFSRWADRIPGVIRHDVENMVAEVEAQIDDFQLELDQIAALFSGAAPDGRRDREAIGSGQLLHVALTLGEISGMTDSVLDPGDWASMIGRMAQQAVAVLLVGTLITGGNMLVALLIVEAVHLGLHERETKKRIREKLGERLHESLQEQVAAKQAFIYDAVEGRFRKFAGGMTRSIQNQIDEVRAEQERILRQRRDERFSVDREKRRLDLVGGKLAELFERVHEVAYGPVPEPAEQERTA